MPTDATPGGLEGALAISVRALTKTFGKRSQGEPALRSVDLDVRRGEFLVLLGPSGCGKTTLLRSIAGLEEPELGVIRIDGEVVFDGSAGIDVDASRRPISMIFQSYALWPHMNARDHVAFPLRCAGVKRKEIRERVGEMLTTVGLGALGDRYPSQMSGGQQQRLALARALIAGRRIVLFDEPLSNVDAQVRERLRLELIRMQRTLGFTAIYVTHDQAEAMELGDRIAVMATGRVAQIDTPRELYRHPLDLDVARFLGQRNEIAFTVDEVDAATGLLGGVGELGRVLATWGGDESKLPAPGDGLVAFGRPRDFEVDLSRSDASGGPGNERVNRWHGTVEAVRFLGSYTECVVAVGEHRLRCWLAREPEASLEGTSVEVIARPSQLKALRGRS